MTEQPFDQAKSEAFAGRMVELLNNAGVVLMMSIGHQVGLFDVMADLPAATSQQIADAARLHERYVREWLGAMTTGQVVEYNPAAAAYSLPREHAAWLTRSAGPNNLARSMQFIPLLAQVEASVIECFHKGGGVPYSAYPQLQRVMGEDTGAIHDAALLDAILPLVPGLPERLRAGIEVAEIGCGIGHGLNLMARAFPQSRFVGYDISEEGIDTARREAQGMGLTNVQFEVRNAGSLAILNRFDLITAFDAIHDMAQPARVLTAIRDALRPDGQFLMVDFGASSHVHENIDFPPGPFLYAASCMHCVPVSLGLDGPGLGAMWGEQKARQMLVEAGFTHIDVLQIEGDLLNNYYIATRR
jgi:SAM-dependent methyltransferase